MQLNTQTKTSCLPVIGFPIHQASRTNTFFLTRHLFFYGIAGCVTPLYVRNFMELLPKRNLHQPVGKGVSPPLA